jgi:hypothetical protein
MGSGLELRDLPTCPKLQHLFRSQRKSQLIFMRASVRLQIYTLFDLEAPENQQMVNMVFVTQSYADIHRKLQKLEGFAGMNATQLLEVASKVFVNQEHEEKIGS